MEKQKAAIVNASTVRETTVSQLMHSFFIESDTDENGYLELPELKTALQKLQACANMSDSDLDLLCAIATAMTMGGSIILNFSPDSAFSTIMKWRSKCPKICSKAFSVFCTSCTGRLWCWRSSSTLYQTPTSAHQPNLPRPSAPSTPHRFAKYDTMIDMSIEGIKTCLSPTSLLARIL